MSALLTRRWTRLVPAALTAILLMTASMTALTAVAHADGDPGSDVLVYSNLFFGGDAGISIAQQKSLGALLDATTAAHVPVRVAIVAKRDDLGSVTAVWKEPATYAKYLGYELSLAYSGRLLIVMPDGFGFYWNGHDVASGDRALAGLAVGPGPGGLVQAAQAAVRRLEQAAGVGPAALAAAIRSATAGAVSAAQSATAPNGEIAPLPAASRARPPLPRQSGGPVSGWVVGLGLLLLLTSPFWLPRAVRRARVVRRPRGLAGPAGTPFARVFARPFARQRWAIPGAAVLTLMAALVVAVLLLDQRAAETPTAYLAHNPDLDPGTPYAANAPNFSLTDQFGRQISLAQFRGKVVLLAFNDAECQTICPLTTQAMLDAKRALGPAGSNVQLLGVDANEKSTSIEDVLSYSQLHGMTTAWHFLTGSLEQLRSVWHAYKVDVEIERGLISHTPALFLIDPQGRLRRVFITQASYAAVPQLGQVLAQEASSLLPGHPAVDTHLSYAKIDGVPPTRSVSLPRTGGGRVELGPGAAHLYVFFATWDEESEPIAGELGMLNQYVSDARRDGLPALTAVDEGSVEPSPAALPAFLHALPQQLRYPVAVDTTGRVADGYEVQGQPWFVLTSASGRIAWWQEVYGSGWPTLSDLEQQVRAALAKTPGGPVGEQAAKTELAGSPAPLAALHTEATQLLGGMSELRARIRGLRGYPIVLNAWASWCTACQAEFGLMASAAERYGKRVAFLGVDTLDPSSQNAVAFLNQHFVSYPSYRAASYGSLDSIYPPGIQGLPTTFLIDPTGRVVHVQDGEYDSEGTLDQQIDSYLLAH